MTEDRNRETADTNPQAGNMRFRINKSYIYSKPKEFKESSPYGLAVIAFTVGLFDCLLLLMFFAH